MQKHKNMLFHGGLVSGLKSDAIRVRILELAHSETSPEKCISLGNAMEVSASFPAHSMPAQTLHHLHLVHPSEILLLPIKEQLNLIRLQIINVSFVVLKNIHRRNAQRDEVPFWNAASKGLDNSL